jgi:SAM-dependent methyltransferase
MSKKEYIKENKKAYNAIAEPFSSTREYIWDDLLPLKQYAGSGDRVLDIGSGAGRLYQLFDDLSICYTGLEQSKRQIEAAKERYPDARFVLGEMTELPFEDGEFDIVYCIATFHHLPTHASRLSALAEMKRVLGDGSYIIMTNWNLLSAYAKRKLEEKKWRYAEDPGHIIVPWRVGSGAIVAERHYWTLTDAYIKELCGAADITLALQYFSTRGERSTLADGDNIVSILKT